MTIIPLHRPRSGAHSAFSGARNVAAVPASAASPSDLIEIIEDYLATFPATTARTYRAAFHQFARWCGTSVDGAAALLLGGDARGATRLVWRYRESLVHRRLSAATINGALTALSSLVRGGRQAGVCTWQLTVRRVPPRRARDVSGPPMAGVLRLLEAAGAHRDPRRGARDRAAVFLLSGLALRRSELTAIDLSDVERDPAGHPIGLWIIAKRSHDRERLAVPPNAATALAAWIAHRGDAPGALFLSLARRHATRPVRLSSEGVNRSIGELSRRAGIGRVRAHGLRHFAVSAALRAGRSLAEVAAFARHRDLRSIVAYHDRRSDAAVAVASGMDALLAEGEADRGSSRASGGAEQ